MGSDKTRTQLISELEELRQRVAELEAADAERRRAEEALREAEERFRRFFENVPEYFYMVSPDGRILDVNRSALIALGYKKEELVGKPLTTIYAPESLPQVPKLFAEWKKTGKLKDKELTIIAKNGERLTVIISADAVRGEDGEIRHSISVQKDITARKKAEEELRREKERARKYLDIAEVMLVVIDADQTISMINRKGCAILGYREGELIGENWFELLVPQQIRHAVKGFFNRLMAGDVEPVEYYENPLLRKDGEERTIAFHNTVIRGSNQGIVGALLSGEDITERVRAEEERRKLEREMREAQKLESLGVLAGGIAHDFNNLLMAVLGNAEMALGDLSEVSPVRPYIVEVEKASRRAADLCKQMLAYSGKGSFVVKPVNLNEVVEEMVYLLKTSVAKKVALNVHLEGSLPPIKADATQIQQVVMNLITNASEAIGEESGAITITTGVMDCDRAYLCESCLYEEQPEGMYDYIEVADSGCGMGDETLAKIFDPFFTTKFTGRGLGLAAVLGIIRGHKGAIIVDSEPGQGTTFKALFPALEVAARASADEKPARAEEWGGSGTILLVDDEEAIRVVGTRMLEKGGFDVLTAEDGCQAVEIYRENVDKIACVLLDLTMPRMDGEETLQQLRSIRDDVRVVLSSGYGEEEITERFARKGISGFIQKPYKLATLNAKLHEALHE